MEYSEYDTENAFFMKPNMGKSSYAGASRKGNLNNNEYKNFDGDGIPSLRITARVLEKTKEVVKQVIDDQAYKKQGAVGMTPLDLPSIDGVSKEEVAELRENLLARIDQVENMISGVHFKNRVEKRLMLGGKDLKNKNEKDHNGDVLIKLDPKISPLQREILLSKLSILNDIYQMSCYELIHMGMGLRYEQIQKKFYNFEDFDEFVSNLTAVSSGKNIDYENHPGGVSSRAFKYARMTNCLIIRNMLNMFDTLMSTKVLKVEEDYAMITNKLRSLGIDVEETGVGKYRIEKKGNGSAGFVGKLVLDKKSFESINRKKWTDRAYGNADSMGDIVRMRFECNGEAENAETNMVNAIDYLSSHLFSGTVEGRQLGELIDLDDLTKKKRVRIANKSQPSTVKTLNNVSLKGQVGEVIQKDKKEWIHTGKFTGTIELQFQYEGAMDSGWEHHDFFDCKKDLTQASRMLTSIGLKNILFYVNTLNFKEIGKTKEETVEKLFFSDEFIQQLSRKQPTDKLTRSKLLPTKKPRTIEEGWGPNAGYVLPVITEKKDIRFITQDSFSPDFFNVYPMYKSLPVDEVFRKNLLEALPEFDEQAQEKRDQWVVWNAEIAGLRSLLLKKYLNGRS